MELAGVTLALLYVIGLLLFLVWPLWAFVLAYRAVRHLFHIQVALFQIRDALSQRSDPVQDAQRHVANSMFGR